MPAEDTLLLLLRGEKEDPCLYLMGEATLQLPPLPGLTVFALPECDWHRKFSPWPAPPLKKGGLPFSGGADAFLTSLTADVVQTEAALGLRPRCRALAGYSLAGLFSLYALTRSPLFSACACVSGSLWYPGWTDYLEQAVFPVQPGFIYLSMGDRESRTRHPLLSSSARALEQTEALLRRKALPCLQEWNPGGHFTDAPGRLGRGIKALYTNFFYPDAKNG